MLKDQVAQNAQKETDAISPLTKASEKVVKGVAGGVAVASTGGLKMSNSALSAATGEATTVSPYLELAARQWGQSQMGGFARNVLTRMDDSRVSNHLKALKEDELNRKQTAREEIFQARREQILSDRMKMEDIKEKNRTQRAEAEGKNKLQAQLVRKAIGQTPASVLFKNLGTNDLTKLDPKSLELYPARIKKDGTPYKNSKMYIRKKTRSEEDEE